MLLAPPSKDYWIVRTLILEYGLLRHLTDPFIYELTG